MQITNNVLTEEGLGQACDDCNHNLAELALVPNYGKRVIRLCGSCANDLGLAIDGAINAGVARKFQTLENWFNEECPF